MSDTALTDRTIWNIPAGQPFARLIAHSLINETRGQPDALSDYTVLLPTRRACRTFQTIFLQITEGKPLLLPKIQPFGDIDEQDLSLALAGKDALNEILHLPPSISPLRRRILLAKAINAIEGFTSGFDQAIALADALAQFMDQIIVEGLNFSALADLVPEEFANHWQITLDFLKILSEHWPSVLKEEGVIEAADRRNRLMRILADHWHEKKPKNPIIAAGSTGSIPATSHLLNVVSQLPNGSVVLPGLDLFIDNESWNALEPNHPQYGFRVLLKDMGVDREAVKLWPTLKESNKDRAILASDLMRPAETSSQWAKKEHFQSYNLGQALQNASLLEAPSQREEAAAIALKFRETLEDPEKTAVLITPDRKLARRVSALCARWEIEVNDSAGTKLNATPIGTYMSLICDAAQTQIKPLALLPLLKHEYAHAGLKTDKYEIALSHLEKENLRGLKPAPGFSGLKARIAEMDETDSKDQINAFIDAVEPILEPLITIMNDENPHQFKEFLEMHIHTAEKLACTENVSGEDYLWREEAGEAMAQLLSELSEQAHAFEPLTGHHYMRIIQHLMSDVSVRPKYGAHPRLTILGQLEARLIEADLVILGSLNEGSWPPDPGYDPWMSRPMRIEFGLPSSERGVGLAAHDFVQGFCNSKILITRSERIDGTAQVPARWLQRLNTVLKANGKTLKDIEDHQTRFYLEALDFHDEAAPCTRPAPKPPVAVRPKRLSVTKIETWLKDPYSIYASEILKLKKLEDLEKPIEAKEKGILLHAILERFIQDYKNNLPNNAEESLQTIALEEIEKFAENPEEWSFWWPRFEKISNWFITNERIWRDQARPLKLELKGVAKIQADNAMLNLSGIADRIDLMHDGSLSVIDYKTGGGFSAARMQSGDTPQLLLEAILLESGAFAEFEIQNKKVSHVAYWSMTGGTESGKIVSLPTNKYPDLRAAIDHTLDGLKTMIDTYADPQIPYICLPRSSKTPRFNDYEHLERIKEWAALEDDDSAAEAAL